MNLVSGHRSTPIVIYMYSIVVETGLYVRVFRHLQSQRSNPTTCKEDAGGKINKKLEDHFRLLHVYLFGYNI